VVKEGNRKDDCQRKQQPQDSPVLKAYDHETEKADRENDQLGDDDIGENGANEESFFTLE
jgi:hypothetical protein